MRRFLYIFTLLFVFQQTYAVYTTPGTGKNWNLDSLVANSAGHITFSGGNYFIYDTLIVSQSDTVKIFSNTTIKLGNLSLIYIYGTLLINPPDSVKITAADTSLKHIGIKLDSLADASVFKRLIFEYGNSINLMYCNMLIDSCTIRFNNNYSTGMQSGAISLFRSNAIITHNKIYRNRRAAVVSASNIPSSPVITDNIIFENDTENGLYPQLNLGAGDTSRVIIRNNIIRGSFTNAGGIAFFPSSPTTTKLVIENNSIKNNSYGIVLYNVNINAYINNNIIDSNNINSNPMASGSGINIYGDSTIKVICTRNSIRWNLWGVTVQGSSNKPPHPDFGNISNSDTADNGFNKIYYNSHNDTTFDFYYNVTTTDTLKAENNYWGTTNADSIEAHIWHRIDFPTLGVVDYFPFRLFTIEENNSSVIPSEYRLFDAYPNPFNPETKISFQLPKIEFVKLEIFDITGKLIKTLLKKSLNSGKYSISWNAANKSSGVYFYRLTAGGFTGTKKLILLK